MEENQSLQQMQFIEQNLQSILMQKQAFQMEISETINSLKEIEKSNDDVFKIVGQLMIKMPKEKIVEELKTKEKLLERRLDQLEKQEEALTQKVNKLREELLRNTEKK
jgi:prefoldin beta subunit